MLSVIASGVYLEKTENTRESWTTVLGAATFLSESHPPLAPGSLLGSNITWSHEHQPWLPACQDPCAETGVVIVNIAILTRSRVT